MIEIYTGLPGAGKSAMLARTGLKILKHNRKYFNKTGRKRVLWSNLKFSLDIETRYHGFIRYWADLEELVVLKDVDVFIDEVGTYFDSRMWENLSLNMRRWVNQHRKFGVEIYGTAQDFAQVDKAFRRCTSRLKYIVKLIGTRDISPTRPAPKWVFVLSLIKDLDPTTYDEKESKFTKTGLVPSFMVLTKDDTTVFDTRAEIRLSQGLPLKHIERKCELSNCMFHKTMHV